MLLQADLKRKQRGTPRKIDKGYQELEELLLLEELEEAELPELDCEEARPGACVELAAAEVPAWPKIASLQDLIMPLCSCRTLDTKD